MLAMSAKHLRPVLVSILMAMSLPLTSFAVPTLTLMEGAMNDTVSGPSPTFSTTIGDFTTQFTGGSSLGGPTSPFLFLQTMTISNNSSSPETLTILFSDNGFGPVTGLVQAAYSASTASSGSATSYSTFLDATNTIEGMATPLTSQGPLPGPNFSQQTSGPLISEAGPFSMTQELVVTLPANGFLNATASLNTVTVPETGASGFGLLLGSLIILEVLRRRCHRPDEACALIGGRW